MVVNLINGRAYIGQTTVCARERWTCHKGQAKWGSNMRFHKAIRQYGVHNFELRILQESVPLDILDYTEEYYISKHDTIRNGYNVSIGGKKTSEETKEKISKSLKGRQFSELHRKRLSEANKRRHAANPEAAKKHMEYMKSIYRSKPVSEETREKYRKRMQGNTYRKGKKIVFKSEEAKQNWANGAKLAMTGKPKTEAHKLAMKEGWRKRKLRLSEQNLQSVSETQTINLN